MDCWKRVYIYNRVADSFQTGKMNNALLEADLYLKQAHRLFLNRKYGQRINGNGSILKTDSQILSKQEI